MSALLNPDSFEFFARFLLAGFVFMSARARFIIGKRPDLSETLVEAVVLSLINQFVFRTLFFWIPGAAAGPLQTEILLLAEVLLLPFVLGLTSGYLLSRNWVPGGLRRFMLPITQPTPLALDVAFSQATREPRFIIITYADGREVFGFFGSDSIAGPETFRGGIFIERIYAIDDVGTWTEANPPRSAWVSTEGVRSIEFIDT